jgi:hypothetical protein
MKNVFISHSSKDSALVVDLAHRLQKIGVNTFTEKFAAKRTRKAGADLIDRRLDHLRDSDEVIVLLTENALASQQITFEIGAALSLSKKITPIVVGVDVSKLPPLLKKQRRIQYAEMENYLSQLEKRVRSSAKTSKRIRNTI